MHVEFPTESARPGRAVLLAVLMGLATIGLVFGANAGDDAFVDAVDGAADDSAAATETEDVSEAAAPVTTAASTTTDTQFVDGEASGGLNPWVYGEGPPIQGVLSAAPAAPTTTEATTTTAAPTTAAPTTAAPTTAAPTTTVASTEATAADGATDPTVDPAAPTESTDPATETTAHPEGWVDAGHGVFVPPVLLQIRFCESTDNYQAANPSSSARGAYQFLTGSWAAYGHADRYGVSQAHLASNAQQDEAALLTWQRDGTRPWNASKHCWG